LKIYRFAVFCFFFLAAALAIAQPPSLHGSKRSQQRQNREADKEDLTRLKNSLQQKRFRNAKILVPLPENSNVKIDRRLSKARRLCRPWTRDFLLAFGAKFYKEFKQPMKVTSATRTVADQKRLRKRNLNAAPVAGGRASSHLTGSTVDITKKGMSTKQIRWMREQLISLEKQKKIEATEEFKQPVFHVMVFKSYLPASKKKVIVQKKVQRPIRK